MREMPFTRPTIVAASQLLDRHTQAAFDAMTLRLALEDEVPDGPGLSVPKKCNIVARIVVQRPGQVIQTVEGNVTLAEAVVREAVELLNPQFHKPDQDAFLRGLARDGYVVELGEGREPHRLRIALPEETALPATDDEVRQLLRQKGFEIPAGHLDQAIEAHTRRLGGRQRPAAHLLRRPFRRARRQDRPRRSHGECLVRDCPRSAGSSSCIPIVPRPDLVVNRRVTLRSWASLSTHSGLSRPTLQIIRPSPVNHNEAAAGKGHRGRTFPRAGRRPETRPRWRTEALRHGHSPGRA